MASLWYTASTVEKRSGKHGPKDLNEIGFRVTGEAVGNIEPEQPSRRSPAVVELGRAGGLVGGKL